MLRDAGLQYNFLSYADVIQGGIPPEYKVLILPACLCLADAEARKIEAFCRAGGTVIADYMPGLWDQHGRGRPGGGVLDALFATQHDPDLKARDVFNGTGLWAEVDQDANYDKRSAHEFLTNRNTCLRGPGGFHRAVRSLPDAGMQRFGQGAAVLLNLSPQWYNAYREAEPEEAKRRQVLLGPILERSTPWVRLKDAGAATHGYEVTYWRKDGRTIVCLGLNADVDANQFGGGQAAGLKTDWIAATLVFGASIAAVRNERTGQELGTGREFTVDWKMNEAVIISFAGPPPREG